MAEKIYTANTGMVTISAANNKLDGTGTIYTVLTAGGDGCHIKSVKGQAIQSTTQGMVRLFVYNGSNTTSLIAEVEVSAVTPSATDKAFESVLYLDLYLERNYELRATTENAESFNVIVEGLDWAYPDDITCCSSTKYSAKTGVGKV